MDISPTIDNLEEAKIKPSTYAVTLAPQLQQLWSNYTRKKTALSSAAKVLDSLPVRVCTPNVDTIALVSDVVDVVASNSDVDGLITAQQLPNWTPSSLEGKIFDKMPDSSSSPAIKPVCSVYNLNNIASYIVTSTNNTNECIAISNLSNANVTSTIPRSKVWPSLYC